jgi:signal peptidase II
MLQIIIVVLAVVADQMSKYYIAGWLTSLPEPHSYPIISNVLHLTYVENRGMALGLFQNSQLPLIIITSLILIAGVYYMIKERGNKSIFFKISLALIVGGAIGNLIDRIFRTFVIDFIDLRFINFFIFNVSDMCICIGAALLAIYILFVYGKSKKKMEEVDE